MWHASELGTERLASMIEWIGAHDHLCLIYKTQEEQFAAVIPFMRIGLEKGEKCVYIADDETASTVMDAMRSGGIDVNSAIKSSALAILNKREAYLKQGYFDPDWMIQFLTDASDSAKTEGYTCLRVTGEMTWILGGEPGVERLIEYEAKLNYTLPKINALAICQYNINRFKPEIIIDVIRTHPIVIYGNLVCRNFYFVPPDEFLKLGQPSHEVERFLENILDCERKKLELQSSEAELKKMNEELEQRAAERTADLEAANKRSQRQTAVLDAINKVFQEAITCQTEEELGKTCLAVAEELSGSKFGFFGELNDKGLFDTLAISNPGWDTRISRRSCP